MDRDNQSSLILHELIYREAIGPNNQHDNSKNARYFREILSTSQVDRMKIRDYLELIRLVDFATAETPLPFPIRLYDLGSGEGHGAVRKDWPVTFDSDGNIATAMVEKGSLSFRGATIMVDSEGKQTAFYPNGAPKALTHVKFSSPVDFRHSIYQELVLKNGEIPAVYFNPDMSISGIDLTVYNSGSAIAGHLRTSNLVCDFDWVNFDWRSNPDPSGRTSEFSCRGGGSLLYRGQWIRFGYAVAYFHPKEPLLVYAAHVSPGVQVILPNGATLVSSDFWFDGQTSEIRGLVLKQNITWTVRGIDAPFIHRLEFYSDGKIREGYLASPTRLHVRGGNGELSLFKKHVKFDVDGFAEDGS